MPMAVEPQPMPPASIGWREVNVNLTELLRVKAAPASSGASRAAHPRPSTSVVRIFNARRPRPRRTDFCVCRTIRR